MKTFRHIWNETKKYSAFNENEYFNTFYCFIDELRIEAEKEENFNNEQFDFFTKSVLYNIQQYNRTGSKTIKEACKDIYKLKSMEV